MTYLHHIHRLNTWNPADFCKFYVAGQHVGYVRCEVAERLKYFHHLYMRDDDSLALSEELTTPEARTQALKEMSELAVKQSIFKKLHGESFSVISEFGKPPLAAVDRQVAYYLGLQNYGVALCGYVKTGKDYHMWLAKRAEKRFEGGKWDVLASGGQPKGLTTRGNIAKEAWEEAGLEANDIIERAIRSNTVSYTMDFEGVGLAREAIVCYAMELPVDFKPSCRETPPSIKDFKLFPLTAIAEMLGEGSKTEFKYNTPLVLLSELMIHGVISKGHPEYKQLSEKLYGEAANAVMEKFGRSGSGMEF